MAFFALLHGLAAYAVFLATFLCAIGFVGNLWVPKSIDLGGPAGAADSPLAEALLINVLLASPALIMLFAQWRPMVAVVWDASGGPLAVVLNVIHWAGWGMVLLSTFLIDHVELFGLGQVLARLSGRGLPAPVFRTPLPYRRVRHPIYLGFLLAFWVAPTMTAGHLLFAIATAARRWACCGRA